MNLKEAFRYEKYLTRLFNEGRHRLQDRPMIVYYDHLRHSAYAKHDDETLRGEGSLSDQPDKEETLDFLLYLLRQKQTLGEAIRRAKSEGGVSLDAETQINAMRRQLYDTLQDMMQNRPRTLMCFGEGTGYYFSEDGTQKEYRYDIRERTVLSFSREKFGEKATALIRQAEKVSAGIERQLLFVQVEYDPPFEVHCSLQEALEQYVDKRKAVG